MDARGRLGSLDLSELRGAAFGCIEGCGFCCTFQPEVSGRELALLRARMRQAGRPLAVAVDPEGRSHLALRNKCGACTLLERRQCQAYDLRPAHCRYFPFHVHFGERPEAYVNYSCRGVARGASGDLSGAFEAAVLAVARDEEFERHERLAREAYGAFARKARRAGAWGDVDPLTEAALAAGPDVLTGAWLADAAARAGEDASPDGMVEDALAPFGDEDVARRPFHLAEDLRWLTFAREGDALAVLEMDEAGALSPVGRVEGVAGWRDPPAALREALAERLRALARRRLFAGSVYALVDDEAYRITVADAVLLRTCEVAVDLALRARILAGLGVSEARLADETARFYDSAFLDSPTIGGFL